MDGLGLGAGATMRALPVKQSLNCHPRLGRPVDVRGHETRCSQHAARQRAEL